MQQSTEMPPFYWKLASSEVKHKACSHVSYVITRWTGSNAQHHRSFHA